MATVAAAPRAVRARPPRPRDLTTSPTCQRIIEYAQLAPRDEGRARRRFRHATRRSFSLTLSHAEIRLCEERPWDRPGDWAAIYASELTYSERYALSRLCEKGLITLDAKTVRLTEAGALVVRMLQLSD